MDASQRSRRRLSRIAVVNRGMDRDRRRKFQGRLQAFGIGYAVDRAFAAGQRSNRDELEILRQLAEQYLEERQELWCWCEICHPTELVN